MPAKVSSLPGRPGNLTKEQEEALKLTWLKLIDLFQIDGGDDNQNDTSAEVTEDSSSPVQNKRSLPTPPSSAATATTAIESQSDAPKQPYLPAQRSASQWSAMTKSDDKHGTHKAFRKAVAELTPAELRDAFWELVKGDNADGMLLRFLRARKWDVDKAIVMLVSTLHWRLKEANVTKLAMEGERGALQQHDKDFMTQVEKGQCIVRGRDKAGRQVCRIRVRLHKSGAYSEESMNKYIVYIIEHTRLCLGDEADTATVIFDMTGFGLANMDYSPLKYMIKCFEAHYPESLGVCLVHQAPWIFQGIWKVVKGWLDPVVASKIHFTKSGSDLAKFIDLSYLPVSDGGYDDYEYKYIPPEEHEDDKLKDEETRRSLEQKRNQLTRELEKVTLQYASSANADSKLIEKRKKLIRDIRCNYVDLDPYVRARSIFDRTKVIQLKYPEDI
ncbi:hypothetical protein CANCADRAFT_27884 [Tortispora caseinolytica NRRL Y-17796]|uniref:CRAL-TRIO domain-containing protein n=1 Tax=Tortispora caseinolytica NRRL Y-17796 TaxID=767744 RepID=A0A1E4TCE3_9ASCO|nr:hypothetical protein CANCADRAFT_27884 [Tortispora caseinolytica NRRL Y-17796]